ncbi:MAG: hydrogenase maturation nickel metallochaperone HypA [Clostridiales bacterium]|jgi:hydrogenase nickel incorporation protein HypA/HybF|nr:hydrogenase maturation nickel metallochaperone HypA [Clostridiales bacterium]
MHEMSLMSGMFEIAADALNGLPVKKVNTITLSVGVLSNALPDALEYAFYALAENTIFECAKLIIIKAGFTVKCYECGSEFSAYEFPIICPTCLKASYAIVGGDEVYIESIDYEEEKCQE